MAMAAAWLDDFRTEVDGLLEQRRIGERVALAAAYRRAGSPGGREGRAVLCAGASEHDCEGVGG
jgi:hypothetical protein